MKTKRWLSGLLAVVLVSGTVSAAGAETLTRGEACERLIQAADDYNPGLTAANVLRGDGSGGMAEDRDLTRAEALVMVSRAFGELSPPVGDRARWAYPADRFTDVPAWASEELENILTSGIVTGASETILSPDAPVTGEELDTLIRRVYAVAGTNRKDDFYATVNKTWLETAEIPAGYPYSGTLYEMSYHVDQQVAAMIRDIAASTPAPGSGEEKIKNLYENALDWEARNRTGVEPIRPYLEAIDAATTLDELMEVHNRMVRELSSSMLVGYGLTVDAKDASRYILTFGSLAPSLSKEMYAADSGTTKDTYLQYLSTLFVLGGETEEQAAADAARYYALERALSAASLEQQEYGDVDKTYNLYTIAELETIFPHVDLNAVLSAAGFAPADRVVVDDTGLLKAAAAYFDDAHLDDLKIAAKAGLLGSFGTLLNREFMTAAETFQKALYGMDSSLPDEDMAAQIVQNVLSDYLGEAFVGEYFSAEAKADVETMIEEFRVIYKSRIQNLPWMSETTKQRAVEKLDSMAVNVGYPDDWASDMDAAEIRSAAQGGSYFDNYLEILKASREGAIADQSRNVDKTEWQMSAYTVNAYYDPSANSINFPAGILQAPFYDVDADPTENLGGIGYVIAHEMTHAFDNNGAKYDKDGNAADWWTAEDYAAFQTLCRQAVAFYDGVEAVPGITCNGTLTLSENIADLGALACITQAESRENQPDYQTLYESAARTWCGTATRETRTYLSQVDVHAPDKLRGNRALQSCDEFYTAFDIQPGDGMWLDPEQRVQIW